MSFVLEADVIKTSPLRGAARVIHILLANHADKDGECFPKQETLAEEAGCGIRYVRKVLAKMVELDLIEITQRPGPGNYHQYKVLTPKGNSRAGSYKEPPEEQPEEPFAPAARGGTSQGEDDSMYETNEEWDRPGRSDEAEEAGEVLVPRRFKKPKYEEIPGNTSKKCRWAFHRGAEKVGHPAYSIKFLNRVIWELHNGEGKAHRPYTYDEIEKLMGVFFARHAQHLRSGTEDIVSAFNYFLPRVQKEAKDSLRTTAPPPPKDKNATMMANYWAEYTKTEGMAGNA